MLLLKNMYNKESNIRKAINDFYIGLKEWRVWYLMAVIEIKMRYKRSKLGQFWITLSNAINILALSVVWSCLFKMSIKDYLPYVTINFCLWIFLNSIITDGSQMFINSARYIQQIPIKKSSFAYMNVLKNFIVFGHNLIVVMIVFALFYRHIGINIFFSFAGLALILINAIWVSLFVGMICARFRDVQSIITSMLQVVFYVTPTMWKLENMPEKIVLISNFNPFNIFISIVRDGMFNSGPNLRYWASAIVITFIGYIITFYAFSKYRSRIVFWA